MNLYPPHRALPALRLNNLTSQYEVIFLRLKSKLVILFKTHLWTQILNNLTPPNP
jgi:hypothetical protein